MIDSYCSVGEVGWRFIKEQIFSSKYLDAKLSNMKKNIEAMEELEEKQRVSRMK